MYLHYSEKLLVSYATPTASHAMVEEIRKAIPSEYVNVRFAGSASKSQTIKIHIHIKSKSKCFISNMRDTIMRIIYSYGPMYMEVNGLPSLTIR